MRWLYWSFVCSYIDRCADLSVPHKHIVLNLNNKLWNNANLICTALQASAKLYVLPITTKKQGTINRAIKVTKINTEPAWRNDCTSNDSHHIWQWLQEIRSKRKTTSNSNFLPDEFSEFYVQLEGHQASRHKGVNRVLITLFILSIQRWKRLGG